MRNSLKLIVATALAGCGSHPAELTSLCIERPEQEGRLNITPISVTLTPEHHSPPVRLQFSSGGQRACAKVPIGQTTVGLRFPYPYGGPGDQKIDYWESKSVVSASEGGGVFILDVTRTLDTNAPGWTQTGWHSMWEVRKK